MRTGWGLATGALVVVLLGCAAGGRPGATQQAQPSAEALSAYKRSKPVLPEPTAFQDFGTVTSDGLTLQLNASLAFGQARQQCDEKPVEAILIPPKVVRQCVRPAMYNMKGCSHYQDIPGMSQPACVVPCPTCSTGIFSCALRADPNQPTPGYRYAKDCYQTPAPADVLGNIRVFAVPEGASRATLDSGGREVGQVTLAANAAPSRIEFVAAPRADECLVLRDVGGESIRVRGNAADADFRTFATPRMQAEKRIAASQRKADAAAQDVAKKRAEVDAARRAVPETGAWRENQCVLPAQRPLPPEPRSVMAESALIEHGRAYCMRVLDDQLAAGAAMAAARAKQLYKFVEARERFPSYRDTPECMVQAYEYPESTINFLRKENFAPNVDWTNLWTALYTVPEAFLRETQSARATQQNKNTLVANMLRDCEAGAIRACDAPRIRWKQQVQQIEAEPQAALASCRRQVERLDKATRDLNDAELAATIAARELAAEKAATIPGQLSLASAVCRAQ